MAIPKKPVKDKDIDNFINPVEIEEKTNDTRKVKKFLIDLPYDLWRDLKMKALKEGIPLKELIINILRKG